MVTRSLVIGLVVALCGCSDTGSPAREAGGMVLGATENREETLLQQEEVLRRQRLQLEKQEREIQDLKRQRLYNDSLRRYEPN